MEQTALLLIDIQKGLDDPAYGERSTPEAEANIARLLAAWRRQQRPIIHVRHRSVEPHSPLRPELPGYAVKEVAQPLPGEKQFTKTVNSAFIGTGLEQYLHQQGIAALIVVGLTTEHCVSTTVRMGANLGLAMTLVHDATAAHGHVGHDGVHYSADAIHRLNVASLAGEFCEVRSTAELLGLA